MALRKRKITKKRIQSDWIVRHSDRIILECKYCFEEVENLPADVGSVICSDCIQLMIEPPKEIMKKVPTEKRPKGWQLRKSYISPSGVEYSFGKEVEKHEILERNPKSSKITKSKKKSK